jgi:hypothetical protein
MREVLDARSLLALSLFLFLCLFVIQRDGRLTQGLTAPRIWELPCTQTLSHANCLLLSVMILAPVNLSGGLKGSAA